MTNSEFETEIQSICKKFAEIKDTCSEFIVGNEHLTEAVFIGVISDGNVLIEGMPGTAKTSVIKIISHLLGCKTKRVQCTVDMQPADILGVRIWNTDIREFELKEGPIFTNILLIDEINRLPPRSQSAFIEALSEKQATIDGITTPLKNPFFAIATQNPIEQEGVFPLIEAQKDRFMLCVKSGFLKDDDELKVIKREQEGNLDIIRFLKKKPPALSPSEIIKIQDIVKNLKVSDSVMNYIRNIVVATREHGDVKLGISTRGSIALLRGAKSYACCEKHCKTCISTQAYFELRG